MLPCVNVTHSYFFPNTRITKYNYGRTKTGVGRVITGSDKHGDKCVIATISHLYTYNDGSPYVYIITTKPIDDAFSRVNPTHDRKLRTLINNIAPVLVQEIVDCLPRKLIRWYIVYDYIEGFRYALSINRYDSCLF